MKSLFVFDLDGTIADLSHRLPLIRVCSPSQLLDASEKAEGFKPDWPAFFDACDQDKPIRWVINLAQMVRPFGDILILSGRSDRTQVKTRAWLIQHGVPYDFLEMRPDGNHEPDEILKLRMLERFIGQCDFEVQFIVDDRQKVVDMWRRNGFNVLQCNAWKE